jgi:hypothetical protein
MEILPPLTEAKSGKGYGGKIRNPKNEIRNKSEEGKIRNQKYLARGGL